MRVLIFPNDKSKIRNPYCELLYGNMEKLGVVTVPFTPWRAFSGRYDIFHLHWPEYYLGASFPKALVGTFGLLFLVFWLRSRGTRIVWTAHNIHSHKRLYPKAEAWFWRTLTSMLDGFIGLSETSVLQARELFPPLRSTPCSVIPHGDYRSSYPSSITKSSARRQLGIAAAENVVLFFGGISSYKNVPYLIETFQRAGITNATLVVAGQPSSREDERRVIEAASESKSIQLHLRRIPTEEVQVFFTATDLVVLPFREITNSGSAILALSFNRPVLVPASGSLPELQAQVGSQWVRTYAGQLSTAELVSGIDWSQNTKRAPQADLASFDWSRIACDTFSAYSQLIAGRSMGTRIPVTETDRA
jgi:beta-1,4-mannosyltransferase